MEIHLAGHTNLGAYIIDTHRGQVGDAVWDLYRRTLELSGPISTLIEWDDEIPEFEVLEAEAEKARRVRDSVIAGARLDPVPRGVPVQVQARQVHAPFWQQGGPRESPQGADP